MIITEKSSGLTEIAVSDSSKALHRKGTEEYTLNGRATIPTADLDQWEETDAPSYTDTEYRAEVERLISERYTTGQELQFAREQHAAGQSYDDYLAVVAQCKEQAIHNLQPPQPEDTAENAAEEGEES